MYTGIIIESSLTDRSVLDNFSILKTWEAGSWTLHKVQVAEDEIKKVSSVIAEGPWYIHFWDETEENIIVVYKDNAFTIKAKDKSTWHKAIEYGEYIGIPTAQLNFRINQDR